MNLPQTLKRALLLNNPLKAAIAGVLYFLTQCFSSTKLKKKKNMRKRITLLSVGQMLSQQSSLSFRGS